MYDIQLSERNIAIEKSKHLGLIGVFVQQNYSQTYAWIRATNDKITIEMLILVSWSPYCHHRW